MKWKSTLWALAFAGAALSCSDDIENGQNPVTPDQEGGYYMTVNIATGGGSALTKANGEEGDGSLEENAKEDLVHDVNIFLVEYKGNNFDTNPLAFLNTGITQGGDQEDATSLTIAGQGYLSLSSAQKPDGGNEPNHDQLQVQISLKEPIPNDEAKSYQVFTVVNAGKKLESITNLSTLRDYIYAEGAWSGSAMADADKFVMSTHQMKGKSGANSTVTLSQENTDPAKPAETTVYVERLAARIDLKVAEELANGTYASDNATLKEKGSFKLNQYTVVNRWNGSSYMFKQVSPIVSKWDATLPGEDATYAQGDPLKYLGDEVWAVSTGDNGRFNYVVDPTTRQRIKDNFSSLKDKYINPFNADNNNLNSLTGWKTDFNTEYAPIAYTKENTMDVAQQKHGYTTGLIFESQFTPTDQFKVSKYADGKVTEVALGEGVKTFLTANHFAGGNTTKVVYADVKSIAALAFDGIDTKTMTVALYKGFMDNDWSGATAEDVFTTVKSIIAQMKESNLVEKAFKEYLNGVASADGAAWDDELKGKLNYDAFLKSEGGKDLALAGDVTPEYIGKLFEQFGVSYFNEGKSYHKFWIRHDNNQNPNQMAVMEFAIVRNNVYRLEVTGIRDLGDPLPFTPGKDDPNNPDESDEISILVNIYVKDWVVRENGGIIL